MSIFDIEDNIDIKIDRDVNIKKVFEQFILTCVMPGTVKCVVVAPKTNSILEKLHELYGVPLCDASFAGRLRETLKAAALGLLPHRGRKVIPKDCRGLKKGDALGWIRDISKDDKDAIVVFENVTQIPEGDPAYMILNNTLRTSSSDHGKMRMFILTIIILIDVISL